MRIRLLLPPLELDRVVELLLLHHHHLELLLLLHLVELLLLWRGNPSRHAPLLGGLFRGCAVRFHLSLRTARARARLTRRDGTRRG